MDLKLVYFLVMFFVLVLVPDSEQGGRRRRRRRSRPNHSPKSSLRCKKLIEKYSDLEKEKDIFKIAEVWAPAVKLAENEKYRPSSINFFLERVTLKGYEGKIPKRLTARNLPQCTDKCYLTTDLKSDVLLGQSPSKVPVYVIIDNEQKDIVEIWYWFFYPFNYGKRIENKFFRKIPKLGKIIWGNHVGDWEKIKIRFENKKLHSIYLATHDEKVTKKYVGEFIWDGKSFKKGEKRIEMEKCTHGVAFAAAGSHGFWDTTGNHVYNQPFPKLVDKCTRGESFDTWNNLKITMKKPEGQLYEEEFNFLNFKGRWGNKEKGCFKIDKVKILWRTYRINFKECTLKPGPKGPTQKGSFYG